MPPFVIFLIGSLVVAFTRGYVRRVVLLAVPVLGALNLLNVQEGTVIQVEVLGYTLLPFVVTSLGMLFGWLFHLAAFLANLYALHLDEGDHPGVQHTSAMLYAGAALGAVFSGDLISLFVFWELLAFTSVFLILSLIHI